MRTDRLQFGLVVYGDNGIMRLRLGGVRMRRPAHAVCALVAAVAHALARERALLLEIEVEVEVVSLCVAQVDRRDAARDIVARATDHAQETRALDDVARNEQQAVDQLLAPPAALRVRRAPVPEREDDEREEGDIMMICVSRCKGKELTLEL